MAAVRPPDPGSSATKDGQSSFFFFGTLMLPAILTRVIGHNPPELRFQDAVLYGYARLHVKGVDYPAIITSEEASSYLKRPLTEDEACVRGTFVSGLSESDVKALDVFEGEEYIRASLPISTLSPAVSITQLSQSIAVPTSRISVELMEERKTKPAWCYVWNADVFLLERHLWDFREFMLEKSSRWTGLVTSPLDGGPDAASIARGMVERDEQEYAEVDALRAQEVVSPTSGKSEEWEVVQMAGGVDQANQGEELPEFGKGLLKYWKFDSKYINLNHGSYGSPPRPVISAMHALSDQVESCPDRFMRKSYLPLLNEVRKTMSGMVNCDMEDLVFVGNAMTAVNTVCWNLDWKEGDIIVYYSTTYGAVGQTLKQVCDRHNTELLEIPLSMPMYHSEIIRLTEEALAAYTLVGGGDKVQGKRVKMVVIDSIASNPGVIMPWEEVVLLCKKYGVLSLVDAAHSIGQLPVDLKSTQPDFWLSNCHKWLMCHRSCALLYVAKDKQHLIRSSLPTSIYYESTMYPRGNAKWKFAEQWEWMGTQDWCPLLAMPAALEFRKFLGGEKRISEYCHGLAVEGGKKAVEILGSSVMENDKGELTANMVNVELPGVPVSDIAADNIKLLAFFTDSLFAANVFAAPYWHGGRWWARMSAQVWNELSDFEAVARILKRICGEAVDGSWKDVTFDG